MGYPLLLSLRYMNSKKGAFISVGTAFAIMGVALGVAALATVMSVTGGFQKEFRDKVLGVNAHVIVLKYTSDFREYREVMDRVAKVPGVVGVGPFTIGQMMVSHGDKTATSVLVKGIDPERINHVLDLPRDIREGSLEGLRRPGALPYSRSGGYTAPSPPRNSAPAPVLPPVPTGQIDPPRDDAGRNLALLRAIEATLGEARDTIGESADGGEVASGETAALPAPPAPRAQIPEPPAVSEVEDEPHPAFVDRPLPRNAPRGSIVPDGGYKSELPADDLLPEDVAPDACASRDAVSKMPGLVIGTTLGKNLGVTVGDCIQVTSPTIGYTFTQGSIRPPVAKQFRVIAIFEAGFDQYDSKLVYTDLFEAQSFYDQGDTVMGVEMKVADIDKARDISRAVDKLLANGLYHTTDWEELNHGLFTALRIQKIMMSLVLFLIILVAAFTVVATLIMIVLEKKKEIAVLKAMGATSDAILRTFLYQGGFIGGAGTVFGLVLGIGVCKGLLAYAFPLDPKVYFISRLPVAVSLQDFVITGVAAVFICLLATVLPALYAARLHPADGLRAQ
ncbi:MAG TPA: ABC transporter permease [Polyangiaceae bacterium]|nr:ABC transporter permease [Polyangiaceae bacterium]